MLKKLIVLLILLSVIISSFNYLIKIIDKGKILAVTPSLKPIIFKTKEIILQKDSIFYPRNFIEVIYFDTFDIKINHNYSTDKVGDYKVSFSIYYNDEVIKDYLDLKIIEKEVITVDRYIYQNSNSNNNFNDNIESPKPQNTPNQNKPIVQEETTKEETIIYEEVIIDDTPYFHVPDILKLPINSSLSDLANLISKNVDTNMQITVDYSSVNLEEIGTYTIYYYSDNDNFTNLIEVY